MVRIPGASVATAGSASRLASLLADAVECRVLIVVVLIKQREHRLRLALGPPLEHVGLAQRAGAGCRYCFPRHSLPAVIVEFLELLETLVCHKVFRILCHAAEGLDVADGDARGQEEHCEQVAGFVVLAAGEHAIRKTVLRIPRQLTDPIVIHIGF